jgi:crotonobetainyl-CoA:carnitine CoA-transferase CaiB-like acyl-CoA transferase
MKPHVDLAGDERFATAAARNADPGALIEVLSSVFATKSAQAWEDELLPQGVGCVAVTTTSIEDRMFDPAFGRASGYVVDVTHPVFDEHPRLAPFIRFSRSRTQALPGVLAGQQTDEILARLGRSSDEIAKLRETGVVG